MVLSSGWLQATFQGGVQAGSVQVSSAQVGSAQVSGMQVSSTQVGSAQVGHAIFPSESGLIQGTSFGHTTQAGIYPTSERSPFNGHFPFSTQPSSVSQNPNSKVWGLIPGHESSSLLL